MKIILGLGIGSGHMRGRNAFNELACSPGVLLEVLEQRVGLSGVRPSQGRRIAAYRRALEGRLESGQTFYADSFQRDPFAVAETLLGWRDELLLNGMEINETAFDSDRIDCLREVEESFDPEFRCSEGERVRQVTLQSITSNSGVESLQILNPPEWLSYRWQCLVPRLYPPTYKLPEFEPSGDSDLGRFQHALLNSERHFDYEGDGSIEFITGYSEAVLAHATAQRIAEAGESAALVDGDNIQLVDEALRRLDEPICGTVTKSRARPIPQLLNLALQLQWLPFDPQRLLDFLMHPQCPVIWALRNRLAKALINEPGVGGREWNGAIERARESLTERHSDDPGKLATTLLRLDADLEEWLAMPGLDPAGADSGRLVRVAQCLGQWANGRAQTAGEEAGAFAQLNALASEFAEIIQEQPTSTRAGVERLLQQLTGNGVGASNGPAELGHVPVLPVSGFIEPIDTVLWWNFADSAPAKGHPWTSAEIAALAKRGVDLPKAEDLARQSAARQLRPVLAARKKLILFKAAQHDGAEIPEHPLWTQLQAAVKKSRQRPVSVNVDEQLAHPRDDAALNLASLNYQNLPRLRRWLELPVGVSVRPRDRESFSSLKSFIDSPFDWVCSYTANLAPGNLLNSRLSVDPRLKGQLVHRLVEIMFPSAGPTFDWQQSTDSDLDGWIEEHWTTLLQEEGAMLLLPGFQSEATALRRTGKATLKELIVVLRRHGARNIIADHEPEDRVFGGAHLRGKIDLCYETEAGEMVVVDLKFGGRDDRRAEVANNTALQLAVYGFLIAGDGFDTTPKSAFYILTNQRWITGDGAFFGVPGEKPGKFGEPDMTTCWKRFQDVWKWRRDQLDKRRLEVTFKGSGFTEESVPPHAAWGPFDNDGKYSDYVNLAGWKEGA